MTERLITGNHARWEVIWWSKKGKQFVIKDFGTDLSGATELYIKVRSLAAPLATLRCCNVGFPPPEKYRPYVRKVRRKERVRGRIRKRIVEIPVDPMEEVNLKGIWWCPYCCKMRKFKKQDGAIYEGYYVQAEGMYCPVCQINHRDHHVRKWNPQAQRIPFQIAKRTRRSSRGTSRRRKRAR